MTCAQRARRPVVLSTFDLADAQELLVHGCEDCACPVTQNRQLGTGADPKLTAGDARRWVAGDDVLDMRLDDDHQLLFNPSGRGGIAVVNDLAHRIFRSIAQSSTLEDVRAAWPQAADDS